MYPNLFQATHNRSSLRTNFMPLVNSPLHKQMVVYSLKCTAAQQLSGQQCCLSKTVLGSVHSLDVRSLFVDVAYYHVCTSFFQVLSSFVAFKSSSPSLKRSAISTGFAWLNEGKQMQHILYHKGTTQFRNVLNKKGDIRAAGVKNVGSKCFHDGRQQFTSSYLFWTSN